MPRVSRSLAGLMVAVAVVAIDVAFLRWLFDYESDAWEAAWYVLPMGNLCAVLAFRVATRGRRSSPFLAGFLAAGLLAMVVFACGYLFLPEWVADPLRMIQEHWYDRIILWGDPQSRHYPAPFDSPARCVRLAAYLLLTLVVPFSLQVNAALAGGWAWDRLVRVCREGR